MMKHEVPVRGDRMGMKSRALNDRESFVAFLFFLSGIPALIYQVAWQRRLVLLSGIGSESIASIVASFMAGLGIGSLIGGRISKDRSSRQCLKWFAFAEGTIGIIGNLTSDIDFGNDILPLDWFTGQPAKMALAHLALLIVPTTLMGMTFPLLAKALVGHGRRTSRVIGQLYALNLFGAATGAILTPWLLFPRFGISGAVAIASGVNLTVCLSALLLLFRERSGPAAESNGKEVVFERPIENPAAEPIPPAVWYAMTFLSGGIGIGLELVWFRVVDVGAKATSFTFGTVLCVYLTGLGLGTLVGVRRLIRVEHAFRTFLKCQSVVAFSTALPFVMISRWPERLPYGREALTYWARYEPISPAHSSTLEVVSLYAIFPLLLFFFPTFFMGLSFVAIQDGIQSDRAMAGVRLGMIQATNIAGCIFGSLGAGLFGFANFGTAGTLRLLMTGFVVMFVLGIVARRSIGLSLASIAMCVALGLSLPDNVEFWRRLHGQYPTSRFHFSEDNAGVTSLIHEGGDHWRVSTNGKGQSRIPFGGVHSKLGALPVTLIEKPSNVAVIGLGSGDTAWAASCRSETQRIDVFEICDDQWTLLSEALASTKDPHLARFMADSRVRPIAQDGRIGLRNADVAYDLIEADAIRPDGAYAGNLYSVEFFRLCRSRLAPGGVMCTWNPTKRTLDSFVSVFPYVIKLDGGQILIGSNEPLRFEITDWKDRLNSAEVRDWLGEAIVQECVSALGSVEIIRNSGEVAGPSRINTDLFPRDEFFAD